MYWIFYIAVIYMFCCIINIPKMMLKYFYFYLLTSKIAKNVLIDSSVAMLRPLAILLRLLFACYPSMLRYTWPMKRAARELNGAVNTDLRKGRSSTAHECALPTTDCGLYVIRVNNGLRYHANSRSRSQCVKREPQMHVQNEIPCIR